jgi:cobalt ECF transporter T component CbiQ
MDLFAQVDTAARHSRWANRHPLDKLVVVACALLAVLIQPNPWRSLAVFVVMSALTLVAAAAPWRVWWRLVTLPLGFTLLSLLPLAVWSMWTGTPDRASAAGLADLANIAARSLAATSAVTLAALTTPVAQLAATAARLGVSRDLVEVALSCHRFVHLLVEVLRGLAVGARVRFGVGGLRPGARLGLLSAALALRTADRARGAQRGMAARGFTRLPLPTLSSQAARPPVWAAAVIVAAAVWTLLPGAPGV